MTDSSYPASSLKELPGVPSPSSPFYSGIKGHGKSETLSSQEYRVQEPDASSSRKTKQGQNRHS